MKKTSVALIGLGAAAGIYLLSKAANVGQAVGKLSWSNPKIKAGALSLTQLPLTLTLDITNPGSTAIPVDYFTGNIMYEGREISSFTFDQSGKGFSIPARSTVPVPFTVIVKNVNTLSTLGGIVKTLLNGGKASSVFTINGSLYAVGVDIPVTFMYDVVANQVVKPVKVAGIGSVKATLEFSDNSAMEKYFGKRHIAKKVMFSKN